MDNNVEFTKHALERIAERGASYEFVVGVVTGGVNTVRYCTSKNPGMLVLTAKDVGGKYWTVIYSGDKVITVRRAHKSEERLYDKKYR